MLVDSWTFSIQCGSIVSSISPLTAYNNNMSEEYDEDYLSEIKGLMEAAVSLKTSVAGTNVELDGVIHSSDTILLHELLKTHKLVDVQFQCYTFWQIQLDWSSSNQKY